MTETHANGWKRMKPIFPVHPVYAYPASNRWRNKPYFQPRWRPKISKPPTKCQVHGCEQLVYSKMTLISLHELERILGSRRNFNFIYRPLPGALPCHVATLNVVKLHNVTPARPRYKNAKLCATALHHIQSIT